MDIKTSKIDNANANASVTISQKELNDKKLALAKEAAKNAKIDGFRKGKVKPEVMLQRYGKGLDQDAKNRLLADSIGLALKELKKEVNELIGEPVVKDLDEKDGVIKANIIISFRPNFDINGYEDLLPKFKAPEVSDKEIEDKINEILTNFAPLEKSKKAKLEKGDFAKFDFEGFLDGKPFEGGKAENYVLQIGSGQFIPGFEDAMIGMKAGENKDINVEFSKDYGAKHLASKAVVFKIKLHEIQQKGEAKLDEKTLKAILPREENPSKEILQKQMKAQIKAQKFTKLLNEELKVKFADNAVEKFNFDVPQNILDQEINMRIRNAWGTFSDDERKSLSQDVKAYEAKKEEFKAGALRSVKLTFIIDELAKLRKISVSEQELLQTIYIEAYRNGLDPKKHLEYYKNSGMLPAVKMAIVEEKLFVDLFKLPSDEESNNQSQKVSAKKEESVAKTTKKASAKKDESAAKITKKVSAKKEEGDEKVAKKPSTKTTKSKKIKDDE